MTRRMIRRDPIENEIELALSPGEFIRDRACFPFVSSLGAVASQIDILRKTDSARAAGLYEIFLAGCREKAEELDDSSGSFGQFAKDLICRWIKARQAAGAAANETAATFLAWMDDDPYAFCYQIEKDVTKAFDRAGLAAFGSLVRARFEATPAEEEYDRRRWSDILLAIYFAQRNPAAYLALAEQIGLKPQDCLSLATIFVSRKPDLALNWVERGIALESDTPQGSAAGYDLRRLQRQLLTKLGREDEALDAAWAEYRKSPSKFSFDDLMKVVPKAERAVWREKALDAAKVADLHSVMELFLETKEMERLADLVRGLTDEELEQLGHYTTEPAAMKLEKTQPGLAARLWRAQGMRIVDAGKSKYYDAAVSNFERARRCFARACLKAEWEETVSQVRSSHRRKTGFMPAFEAVASGAGGQGTALLSGPREGPLGRKAYGRPCMKKRDQGGVDAADLDGLIEEITVDANGEDEQLWALRQAFEDDIAVPCDATVIGEPVRVVKFDYDGNNRRGLTATCRRSDGTKHVVAASDVVIPLTAPGGRHLAAYRKWMGLAPFPPGAPVKARRQSAALVPDLKGPVELVVLSVKQKAARCRLLGGERTFTFRAGRLWDLVPGEIAAVRPAKQWTYAGNPYLSGIIESTRLDARVLGLARLRLEERGLWNPAEHYWGEEGEPIEEWAKPVIAGGPRPEFEMEQVLPGADPDDSFSDPIGESNDRKDAGDGDGAYKILMDLCQSDLRCLDAHAHLGNFVFDRRPKDAIRHYEVGFRIGELSLDEHFTGVLPWGWIDNRPFLRCMHGFGLCLWRLGRFEEAGRVFERMLWLNPSDNQGVRFLIDQVRAKDTWEDSQ